MAQAIDVIISVKNAASNPTTIAPITLVAAKPTASKTILVNIVPKMPITASFILELQQFWQAVL